MLDVSTSGIAQPKTKTINVEANLLAEWLDERMRVRTELTRMAGLVLVMVLSAIVTLPPALRSARAEARASASAASRRQERESELARLKSQLQQAQPHIDEGQMMDALQELSRSFIGNTVLVLNSAPTGLAFSSVKSQVNTGVMTLHVQAEAESYDTVRSFLDAAGQGPGVKASLLAATKRSETLGPDGLSFEYTKKVQVGK